MTTRFDEAIVLRITEYSETSQVIWFLTPAAGQVRLIAKGVKRSTRKKAAVGLDLLERGEIGYVPARQHAELGTMTEWTLHDAHLGLRRSLPHLLAGLYAADLLAAFSQEDDPARSLFRTTARYLEVLAKEAAAAPRPLDAPHVSRLAALVLRYQRRLLEAVGFMPRLEECVACGRKPVAGDVTYFSASCGGLLCRHCAQGQDDRRRLPGQPMPVGLEGDARAWVEVLDHHLAAVLGRQPATSSRLRAALTPTRGARGR